jgi:hypothetical protein
LLGLVLGLLATAAGSVCAQSLYEAFVKAVALDRSDEVRKMLVRGMDPNTVDPNGDPVLLVPPGRDGSLQSPRCRAGPKVDAANKSRSPSGRPRRPSDGREGLSRAAPRSIRRGGRR